MIRYLFFWLFLCLSVFSTVVAAQSRGPSGPKSVLLEPIVFEYATENVEAVGTAEAKRSVTLFSAAADRVIAVNFVPGQKVAQGDVLLELDARRQEVAVVRAKIQLADAQRTFARIVDSEKRGAAPVSALDDAKTSLELAKVALKQAEADLEDRFVLAPFSGVVGLTDVEVGDRINTQTVLTTIDQRDEIYVNFTAPESALAVLLDSPKISLQPWSNRTTYVDATIAEVDSRINTQDRTIKARALLDNSADKYRPGMSFRVNLSLNGERYAAIPEAALSWGSAGAYIWTANDGKAKRVDVKVKQRLRGRILVEGALAEGDDLITEGIQRLRIGQAVKGISSSLAEKSALVPAEKS
jgi:RND family efflux transporter MFP subunit